VTRDSAYKSLPLDRGELKTYIVVAEGEEVDAKNATWNFSSHNYADDKWMNAHRN